MEVAMIDDQMLPVSDLGKAHLDRGLYFGDGVLGAAQLRCRLFAVFYEKMLF